MMSCAHGSPKSRFPQSSTSFYLPREAMRNLSHSRVCHHKQITYPSYARPSSSSDGPVAPSGPYTRETYKRRSEHVPNTGRDDEEKYIVALRTDSKHHTALNNLRKCYFPQSLNKVPAHVCLFHALPGSQLPRIRGDIGDVVRKSTPSFIRTLPPRSFANEHGVALPVDAPIALKIFEVLKSKWRLFLSKQDHSFRAHYTVANQLDEAACLRVLEEVQKTFTRSEGQVIGLTMARYEKGFWKNPELFMFPNE